MVTQPVLLDVDAEVAGVQIEPAGDLVFDPGDGRTLHSTGNVVVSGRLRDAAGRGVAGPHACSSSTSTRRRFEGGHSDGPLEDRRRPVGRRRRRPRRGQGTPKTAWTNAHRRGLVQGDRSITVADAAGWQVGDEIVVTPTEPTTVGDHWVHHDRRTITSVDGNRIELDRGLEFAHPVVTVRPGVTHTAEVLNLTRNMLIQGTPEGRSHVIMLSAAQAPAASPTSGCATWAPGRATTRCWAATPSTSTPTTTARGGRRSRGWWPTTPPATRSPPTCPTASRSGSASPTTWSTTPSGGT